MTRWKVTALVALLLCMVALCCACVAAPKETTPPTQPPTEPTVDPVAEAYKKDRTAFVRFWRSTEPREGVVPVAELMEYESIYPDCNGTWFQDQLSGEDLLLYNSYLYAMENRFIGFDLYVEDSDKNFDDVRIALSLDSPFLEQSFSYYERLYKNPVNHWGESVSVRMEQFTDTRWDMKLEALEKCRQIVAGIPTECVTQEQKMRYLHQYVCDHVEYVAYEEQDDEDHLYDAVCKGKAVCDGYSNMLNLLFNLIGVECSEVMGSSAENLAELTEEEYENASQHTWVVAQLDGQFYNFDPTWEDTDDQEAEDFKYFAYSDDLSSEKYLDCEQLRPKCTDTSRDYLYADVILTDHTDSAQRKTAVKTVQARMEQGIYETAIAIYGDLSEKERKAFVRKCVDQIDGITSASCIWYPKRNSILIYMMVDPR